MDQIYETKLSNGIVLLGEPIAGAGSLAMSMMVPGGLAAQPSDQEGVASVLSEMICRGAGGMNAREHSEALDMLGVERATHVDTHHMKLSATMIGTKVGEALPMLVDMVRRPTLEEDALEPTLLLALQALEALKDDPQQYVVKELRRRHNRLPFGRSSLGEAEHLKKMTIGDVKKFWEERYQAGGTILSFAGAFDWDELVKLVEAQLGDWGGEAKMVEAESEGERGYEHLKAETSQTHIALAYDSVADVDPESIYQKAAVQVLSGGMSGRLFTEVREKRGLCYSVYASYGSQRDRGMMFSYAGTTTARAQETLDVLVEELKRLSEGIDQSEFDRAVVGMKSRLVMQGESSGARANAIGAETFLRGKAMTLDEWASCVDGITIEKLNAYLKKSLPGEMTIVTMGEDELKI
ncbi:insulinase family protein [Planctomycetota bacterium]|nr:insulinase family protein [Planctomycetota bacterium]